MNTNLNIRTFPAIILQFDFSNDQETSRVKCEACFRVHVQQELSTVLGINYILFTEGKHIHLLLCMLLNIRYSDIRIEHHISSGKGKFYFQCIFRWWFLRRACGAYDACVYSHVHSLFYMVGSILPTLCWGQGRFYMLFDRTFPRTNDQGQIAPIFSNFSCSSFYTY